MNLRKCSLVLSHIRGELQTTISETCYVFTIRVNSWWSRQNTSVKHPFCVCGLLVQASLVHLLTIKIKVIYFVRIHLHYLEEPHYSVTFTCNITFLFCSCDAIHMKFDHEETRLTKYIHFPMAKVKSL